MDRHIEWLSQQSIGRLGALLDTLEGLGRRMTDQVAALDSAVGNVEAAATTLQSAATHVEGIINDLQAKVAAAPAGPDISAEIQRLSAVGTALQSVADSLGSETETPTTAPPPETTAPTPA